MVRGSIHGGQQPVANAKVYLYAAGDGGYGTSARSMLHGSGYVNSMTDGSFTITGDYTCETGDEVYLLAVGGNPGATDANDAITLIAPLGACDMLTASQYFTVNELTTVSAAYALAQFMPTPTTLSSSGSPLGKLGIANAFLTAANLVNNATGISNTVPVGLNGTVPTAELNTLGNMLAACVNSSDGGAACSSLFSAATPPGGTAPSDTAQAAIDIAQNPGNHVATLFALSSGYAPFQPALPTPGPNDWSVAINFTGGGLNGPGNLAVDGLGDIWLTNINTSTVSEFSPAGTPVAVNGYTGGTLGAGILGGIAIDSLNDAWVGVADSGTLKAGTGNVVYGNGRLAEIAPNGTFLTPVAGFSGDMTDALPNALAFDPSGHLWTVNVNVQEDSDYTLPAQANLAEFASDGTLLSPTTVGYTGGGLTFSKSLACDVSGDIWVANTAGSVLNDDGLSVSEFSTSGSALSPSSGWTGGGIDAPQTVAIDHNGNIWVADPGALSELNSAGTALSTASAGGHGYTDVPVGTNNVVVDGNDHIWALSRAFPPYTSVDALVELSDTAAPISPASGYQSSSLSGSTEFAIDGSGNVWIPVYGTTDSSGSPTGLSITEFVGLAAPVVTPLAVAVASNKLGVLP